MTSTLKTLLTTEEWMVLNPVWAPTMDEFALISSNRKRYQDYYDALDGFLSAKCAATGSPPEFYSEDEEDGEDGEDGEDEVIYDLNATYEEEEEEGKGKEPLHKKQKFK